MHKIMFVCHGNICRSPMAEFILKDMAAKAGTADAFVIASSATSTEEIRGGIGNPVYPPAAAELAAHGIACAGKRAVQLQKSDYAKYDLFVGMDSANIRNMHRIFLWHVFRTAPFYSVFTFHRKIIFKFFYGK